MILNDHTFIKWGITLADSLTVDAWSRLDRGV